MNYLGFGKAKELANANFGKLKEYKGMFCWDEYDTKLQKMVTCEGILFEDIAHDVRKRHIDMFVKEFVNASLDEVIDLKLRIPAEWNKK